MNKLIWGFFTIGFILQIFSGREDENMFRLCLGISGTALGIAAIILDLCGVR